MKLIEPTTSPSLPLLPGALTVPVGSHTVYLLLIAGNKCPFTKYSNDFLSYLGTQRNPRPLFSDIPCPLRGEYCGLVQGPSFDWMQYFRVPMLWGSC